MISTLIHLLRKSWRFDRNLTEISGIRKSHVLVIEICQTFSEQVRRVNSFGSEKRIPGASFNSFEIQTAPGSLPSQLKNRQSKFNEEFNRFVKSARRPARKTDGQEDWLPKEEWRAGTVEGNGGVVVAMGTIQRHESQAISVAFSC